MIRGIGVDIVSLSRFQNQLQRTPALRQRLFTETEQQLSGFSLAARFAAKEAVAKVLGAPAGLNWQDCEVTRETDTAPRLLLSGAVAAAAQARGITSWHLSLSHDGDHAVAMVIAEG